MLVISLIFESIDKIPGRERTQISLLVWDKLRPRVKPEEPLRLAINDFSMQRSGEMPDQNVLLRRITNKPFLNSDNTSGFNSSISWRNQNNDFV